MWVKVHDSEGEPILVNLSKVEYIARDRKPNVTLVVFARGEDATVIRARESLEDLELMLMMNQPPCKPSTSS